MKKFILSLAFLFITVLLPARASASIAYNTGGTNYCGAGTTCTVTTTSSGFDRIAIITIINGTGDVVSSVDVGGVNATFIQKYNISGTQWQYIYYYIAPPTASTAYNVNTSVSSDNDVTVLTYTGASQTAQPDSYSTGSGSPNATLSTTVVTANSWLVSVCRNTSTGNCSAGTGTTNRFAGTYGNAGDSGGNVGSGTQNMQWTAGAGNTYGTIVSIAPSGGGGGGGGAGASTAIGVLIDGILNYQIGFWFSLMTLIWGVWMIKRLIFH